MSSENVGRRKSYRWASASHASYDGGDWDSSDESVKEEEGIESELPKLPKLNYSSDKKNRSVNDDLDDLMAQISMEMTPKEAQGAFLDENEDRNSDLSDYIEEEFTVSRTGYYNNFVDSDVHEQEDHANPRVADKDSVESESTTAQYVTPREPSLEPTEKVDEEDLHDIDDANSVADSQQGVELQISMAKEEDVHDIPDSNSIADSQPDVELQIAAVKEKDLENYTDQGDVDDILSIPQTVNDDYKQEGISDEDSITNMSNDLDDNLSYTKSINYQENNDQEDNFRFTNKELRESIIDSSDEDEDYGINARYSDDESSNKSDDRASSSNDDNDTISSAGGGKGRESLEDQEASINDSDKDILTSKGSDDDSDSKSVTTVESDDKGSLSNDNETINSTGSVQLNQWKPDTDGLRSGFVQGSANKAPPGFVYDEDGKLIDLTPSSMKSRVVSTYSEIESAWNAFPSDGIDTDELETIRDTKTIYDNSTIYNVPGLITNHHNLPPLPNNGDTQEINDNQLMKIDSNKTITSENDKRSIRSNHTDILGISEPNSQQIAKVIDHDNTVPELNLNKLINSKISNDSKLQQLKDYYGELNEFDSGIQTWISYSLKSSSKEDKDYLMEEYKNNRHVREAYANAEDITRKNTVINTVNTVNQNVNHLKKKVLSHTIKSKQLFSSIGKKKL
ncbi:hypothetical protein KAFR_0C06230 [Kazachstania africana CBS 2517]|uniref:Protein FYV8 n=1 Tax=Kazachstania africana (strain ATCC 22294 / BCRC 22015 / CBS 2517 / CECT 1963 / NBRC 1671 / NRRL Y-8276) TaxID=1071382 RepID=H2ATB5_KAZAF|nr:hypothetical protein KAFR_0C06230 [Kazachstania africana CBS 2517]CCF57615.1 hypothetical protein KAFR_0C06230 [Kazachstania africana CBS 2517]